MLIELVYCSAARIAFTPAELTRLVRVSRQNNARDGITGILLYSDGSFFQVLEGEEKAVDELFSRIEKDERHHSITVIVREPIARRSFGDWSMGYAGLMSEELADLMGGSGFFGNGEPLAFLGESRAKRLLTAFTSGRWRSRLSAPVAPRSSCETGKAEDFLPDFSPASAEKPARTGRFSFAFQPIIDCKARRVFAYEALIRGERNEPAQEVLEGTGSSEMPAFLEESRLFAIQLAAHMGLSTRLTLNVPPSAVMSSTSAIASMLEAAECFHVRPEQLVLEILESELIEDSQRLANALRGYRTSGLRFAIDDFGAGYAGLNLLAAFQPHWIKLDQQLVRGVDRKGPSQAIIRGIVRACLDLGIDVIAEGIETENEYRWLRHEGIDLVQGYFFARPKFEALPADFHLPG